MDEEWELVGPFPPRDEFPGDAPRRLEMEGEGGEEAIHGDAPWAEPEDGRRR